MLTRLAASKLAQRSATGCVRQVPRSTQQNRCASAMPKLDGILKSFTKKDRSSASDLTFPLNGSKGYPSEPTPAEAPKLSKLQNGLRVVSSENHSPLTSLGLFVDAGSRYGVPLTGSFQFLERMAFQSNSNFSALGVVRESSRVGVNLSCSSSRDYMLYSADAPREHVPFATSLLRDIVFTPKFNNWEIERLVKMYEHEFEEGKYADDLLDMALSAAYRGNTLGIPNLPLRQNLHRFTSEYLHELVARFYTPERMVFSAAGLGHSDAVAIAEEAFGSINTTSQVVRDPAEYSGGEVRVHTGEPADGLTHMALGFGTPKATHKDIPAICVLQTLLGGGGSFSAGGPGKGMHSRLYLQLLNRHSWAVNTAASTILAHDSGLFLLSGSTFANDGSKMLDALVAQAQGIASEPSEEELARAKTQLRNSLLSFYESRVQLMDDMGRRALNGESFESLAEIVAKIEAVTTADLAQVGRSLLQTPLTFAAKGNLSDLPRYDTIAGQLN